MSQESLIHAYGLDFKLMAVAGKPLFQKLGIKRGATMAVIDPPQDYWELLEGLPDGVSLGYLCDSSVDFVHIFVKEKASLEEQLGRLKERIAPHGMIWVSWLKRSSKVETDLSEGVKREMALQVGLVDMKVCSVDETWSELKLVIRREDRKQSLGRLGLPNDPRTRMLACGWPSGLACIACCLQPCEITNGQ